MAITEAPKIVTSRLGFEDSHTLERYLATGGYDAKVRLWGAAVPMLFSAMSSQSGWTWCRNFPPRPSGVTPSMRTGRRRRPKPVALSSPSK